MLAKTIYVIRLLAFVLILFLIISFVMKWDLGKGVLVAVAFFLLLYVLASMLLVIMKFRTVHQKPPAASSEGMPEISDTPEDKGPTA